MLKDIHAKPKELAIAVRAFAMPLKPQKAPRPYTGGLNKPSRWTVVFDTETTADEAFTLRLGAYHVYKDGVLYEKGIFFNPQAKSDKILSAADIERIRAYAADKGFRALTPAEFIDQIFYRYGYRYGGAI